MLTSRLNLPARKFFLKDIKNAEPAPNNTAIPNLPVWTTTVLDKKTVQFSIVWIQGRVKNIVQVEGEDKFILDDGTADALVFRTGSMPQGGCEILKDKYIMVVGELQQCGQQPVIKVMKIQDLSKDCQAEAMWNVEVLDLYSFT